MMGILAIINALLVLCFTNLIANGDFEAPVISQAWMIACPALWNCFQTQHYNYVGYGPTSYVDLYATSPGWISQIVRIPQPGIFLLSIQYWNYNNSYCNINVLWNNVYIDTLNATPISMIYTY